MSGPLDKSWDKLLKAFESLHIHLDDAPFLPPGLRKKDGAPTVDEKKHACHLLAESILGDELAGSQDYGAVLRPVIETLCNLCDDANDSVRNLANETLNAVMKDISLHLYRHLTVAFAKVMQRDGIQPRIVKSALCRFASLVEYILPAKAPDYARFVFPIIVRLLQAGEAVQAELVRHLPPICRALVPADREINLRAYLTDCLTALDNQSPFVRRTAATFVSEICANAQTPRLLAWTLEQLRCSRPGHLLALRLLAPLLAVMDTTTPADEDLTCRLLAGTAVAVATVDRVTASPALEAMRALLDCSPAGVVAQRLLRPGGLCSAAAVVLSKPATDSASDAGAAAAQAPATMPVPATVDELSVAIGDKPPTPSPTPTLR